MTSERRKAAVHVVILILLCIYFFFWGIDKLHLFGTEAHRALPAREMLATHDWLIPRLNGEPFLTKPPLTYWMIGIFSVPQGRVTEVSARLPSAFCAVFVVLFVYWFVRGQAGSGAGFLSALVGAASILLIEKAISAEIDVYLALWVTVSMLLAYRSLERGKHRLGYALGAYIALSLAFLSKGPPAIIFFAATLASYLIWEKRVRALWSRENILGILVFLSICSIWILAVAGRIGWGELSDNVHREFLSRVGSSTPFHVLDILFYPAGIAAGFAPWSIILPFGFLPSYYGRLDGNRKSLQRFLYCGILVNLILFSAVAGKANRYLLPIYPLMAIIVGLFWHDLFAGGISEEQKRMLKNLGKIMFGLAVTGTLGFIIVKTAFNIPEFPASVPIYMGLTGVSVAGFFLSRRASYRGIFTCLILVVVFYKLIFVFDYVPYRNSRHSIQHIAKALNECVEPGNVIYCVGFNKPHIFFYLHNPVIKLSDISSVHEAGETSGSTQYCILTEEELRLLEDDYSDKPKLLCDFTYHETRVSLVALNNADSARDETARSH